jgi:hypothetical protein
LEITGKSHFATTGHINLLSPNEFSKVKLVSKFPTILLKNLIIKVNVEFGGIIHLV